MEPIQLSLLAARDLIVFGGALTDFLCKTCSVLSKLLSRSKVSIDHGSEMSHSAVDLIMTPTTD